MSLFSKDKSSKPAGNRKIEKTIDPDILIGSIGDGVVMIDEQGVIQIFNQTASDITGWDSDEAIGLSHKSVMTMVDHEGKMRPDTNNPIIQCSEAGEAIKEKDTYIITHSKKITDVSLIVTPIQGNTKPTAVVGIFRDVSEERGEERQRAEFISTASHEMRTPVAAIEGYLALAMNEKVAKIDSNARKYLEKAKISTLHLGKLFQDLLTAGKTEDGRLANHPRVIEVGSFLGELTENLRFSAEKKGLQVEFNFTGTNVQSAKDKDKKSNVQPVYYIHADPDRVREVITNLFDNAVKYTEEGRITIGMGSEGNNVLITLTDTGVGIPKEHLPHLFQKFYRVDSTATRTIGGTGLGLFISKKIIELYSGTITVESDLNKGSTFTIQVPKLDPTQAQQLMKQEAAQQSPLSETAAPSTSATPDNHVQDTQS